MSLAIHDSIKFLEEAAKYFEKRPTGGEDKAYWANVYNAEHCRKIIEEIERLEEVAESYRKTANELSTRVAQTEEKIEQARITSQYWKSDHIAANVEIDRLRNIISVARECLDADDVIGAIEILEKNND